MLRDCIIKRFVTIKSNYFTMLHAVREIITKINACYQSKNSSYIIKERIFCLNIFFVIQLVHLYCVVHYHTTINGRRFSLP
jgi:hypothetical protein